MKKSRLLGVVCACLSTFNANAAIVSVDWQTGGDNLITQDTDSGLEWLDLTVTAGMSFNDVTAQLGVGGDYEGWRYATSAEVTGLWDAFGGDNNYYTGSWSTQNNGLFDAMAPYVGDLYCAANACTAGDGYSYWITSDVQGTGYHWVSLSYDDTQSINSSTSDLFSGSYQPVLDSYGVYITGSALVRDISSVPVPAAAWLFGTGLVGLIGVARRKIHV